MTENIKLFISVQRSFNIKNKIIKKKKRTYVKPNIKQDHTNKQKKM